MSLLPLKISIESNFENEKFLKTKTWFLKINLPINHSLLGFIKWKSYADLGGKKRFLAYENSGREDGLDLNYICLFKCHWFPCIKKVLPFWSTFFFFLCVVEGRMVYVQWRLWNQTIMVSQPQIYRSAVCFRASCLASLGLSFHCCNYTYLPTGHDNMSGSGVLLGKDGGCHCYSLSSALVRFYDQMSIGLEPEKLDLLSRNSSAKIPKGHLWNQCQFHSISSWCHLTYYK